MFSLCDRLSCVAPQVKEIRVTISQTDKAKKGRITAQMLVGTFVIPKCAQAGTKLVFDFERQVKGNVVHFEALSNYGGDHLAPAKISVF